VIQDSIVEDKTPKSAGEEIGIAVPDRNSLRIHEPLIDIATLMVPFMCDDNYREGNLNV
jgi:hypothetical protein